MNRLLTILVSACFVFIPKATSQFIDSFTDSTWYLKNSWAGQVEDFKINEDKQLQSIGNTNGKSSVYAIYNTYSNQEWEFWCKLNFAPSESNKFKVYLYADDTSYTNAYYLEIGENGSQDALKFIKSRAGKTTLVAEGNLAAVSKDPTLLRLRISRSELGNWIISTDYNGGNAFTEEIFASDKSILFKPKGIFAIECNYTTTRRDKFFFDDLSIKEFVPRENPPRIIRINSDSNQVHITFDKAIDPVTANDEENYLLSGSLGQPWKAKSVADSIVILYLTKNISAGTYEIVCKKISDLKGNSAFNLKSSWTHTLFQNIDQYELLITEIMADPTPAIGLPPFEYIELFNRGHRTIDLAGIKLFFEKTEFTLDTNSVLLKPGEFIVLCESLARESFKSYGNIYGLKKMPVLRNTNGTISITEQSKIIHSVTYDDDWYRDTKKKEGGWSLEMINPENVCDYKDNWTSSTSSTGGSPGSQNSVWNQNAMIPTNIDSFIISADNQTLDLYLNKKMDMATSRDFQIKPNLAIGKLAYIDSLKKITIQFTDPFTSGIVYTLTADSKDCLGRVTNPVSVRFSKPEKIEKNDLVINEVLFNPPGGGADYIELYNKSSKAFTLRGIRISNELNQRSVSLASTAFVLPGAHFVICANTDWIKTNYNKVDTGLLLQHSLPSLPDEEGHISIRAPDGLLIDSFYYTEKYHYPLLNSKEGVALERVDVNSVNRKSNWHSASGAENYGTPTRKNSVSFENVNTAQAIFTLKNKTFSPNGDGEDDDLHISYTLPDNGYQSKIVVFDDNGRRIRTLYNNILLSRSGEITWDGKNDEDQTALNGIYIVNIEAIHVSSKLVKKKMAVVLYR